MITPPEQAQINFLDGAYQKLSGIKFHARGVITGREEAWHRFIQEGFTVAQLETVILWLKRGIREERRQPNCLRFSTLIEPDRFDEELGLAEAEKRNLRPAPSPKDIALSQLRPTTTEQAPVGRAIPISDVIAAMRRAVQ
jgi:hypothetical protein